MKHKTESENSKLSRNVAVKHGECEDRKWEGRNGGGWSGEDISRFSDRSTKRTCPYRGGMTSGGGKRNKKRINIVRFSHKEEDLTRDLDIK